MSNGIGIGGPGRLAGKVAVVAGAGGGMGSKKRNLQRRYASKWPASEGARVLRLVVARRAARREGGKGASET